MGGCLSRKKQPRQPTIPHPGVICHITLSSGTGELGRPSRPTSADHTRSDRQLPQQATREPDRQLGRERQVPRLELEAVRCFDEESSTDESTDQGLPFSNYYGESDYQPWEDYDGLSLDHSNQPTPRTTPASQSFASTSDRSSPRSSPSNSSPFNSGSSSIPRTGSKDSRDSLGARSHPRSGFFARDASTSLSSRARQSIGDSLSGASPGSSRSHAGTSSKSTRGSSSTGQDRGHIIQPPRPPIPSNSPRWSVAHPSNRSSPRPGHQAQTLGPPSHRLLPWPRLGSQSGSSRSSTPRSSRPSQTRHGSSRRSSPRAGPAAQDRNDPSHRSSLDSARIPTSPQGSSNKSTPRSSLVAHSEYATGPRTGLALRGRSGSLSSAGTSSSLAIASAIDASAVLSKALERLSREGRGSQGGSP